MVSALCARGASVGLRVLNKVLSLGEGGRGSSSPHGDAEVAAGGGTPGGGAAAAGEPACLPSIPLRACARWQRQYPQLQAPAWLSIRLPACPANVAAAAAVPAAPSSKERPSSLRRPARLGGFAPVSKPASRSRSRVVCGVLSQTAPLAARRLSK